LVAWLSQGCVRVCLQVIAMRMRGSDEAEAEDEAEAVSV
jgi:hypothetical protein